MYAGIMIHVNVYLGSCINTRTVRILPMRVTEGWATIEDVLPLRHRDDFCDAE